MSTGYFTPPPGQPYRPPGSLDLILYIVTREEWKAVTPTEEGRQLNKHPLKVVVEHFSSSEPCSSPTECVKAVQDMQQDHMQQGFRDIKFNFLIGGDGHIYEGRGWHVCSSQSLIDIPNKFHRRLDIAYIGDFTGKEVPELMVQRKNDVVDFAVRLMIMARTYVTVNATRKNDIPTAPRSLDITGWDLAEAGTTSSKLRV